MHRHRCIVTVETNTHTSQQQQLDKLAEISQCKFHGTVCEAAGDERWRAEVVREYCQKYSGFWTADLQSAFPTTTRLTRGTTPHNASVLVCLTKVQ